MENSPIRLPSEVCCCTRTITWLRYSAYLQHEAQQGRCCHAHTEKHADRNRAEGRGGVQFGHFGSQLAMAAALLHTSHPRATPVNLHLTSLLHNTAGRVNRKQGRAGLSQGWPIWQGHAQLSHTSGQKSQASVTMQCPVH